METPSIAQTGGKAHYYPALDGIRAFAVMMVVLVHYLPSAFPYGWVGVQIFFVLSGFLITGILFDSLEDEQFFRNFYVRRLLRIFPLYYGFLAVCSVVLLLTRGHVTSYFGLWFVYLQNFFWLFTRGQVNDLLKTGGGRVFAAIGPLWSLAVEEQFYLIWPVLVLAVKDRRKLMLLCCAGIVFRLVLGVFWQAHYSHATLEAGLIYRMLPTQCDGFLMGGYLALWIRGGRVVQFQQRSGLFAVLAIAGLAAILALLHRYPGLVGMEDVFSYTSGFQATIGLPLSNLVSASLLLAALRPGSWVFRLATLRPILSLGRVSYGIYVYHLSSWVACGFIIRKLSHATNLHGLEADVHAILAFVLTIVASYLSYHLYEKHFLLLKDRFTAHPIRHGRHVAS